MELGGNAACVIDEVVPDIDAVVKSVIHGAFYQSGQSCISVQRIFVNASIYGQVRDAIVAAAEKLRMGDPRDEATFIGPMIDVKEADRVERWVEEAKAAGGKVFQHKSYGGLRA